MDDTPRPPRPRRRRPPVVRLALPGEESPRWLAVLALVAMSAATGEAVHLDLQQHRWPGLVVVLGVLALVVLPFSGEVLGQLRRAGR